MRQIQQALSQSGVSHLLRLHTEEHLKSFLSNDTDAFPHFRLVFDNEAVFQVEKQTVKSRRLRTVNDPDISHNHLSVKHSLVITGNLPAEHIIQRFQPNSNYVRSWELTQNVNTFIWHGEGVSNCEICR